VRRGGVELVSLDCPDACPVASRQQIQGVVHGDGAGEGDAGGDGSVPRDRERAQYVHAEGAPIRRALPGLLRPLEKQLFYFRVRDIIPE